MKTLKIEGRAIFYLFLVLILISSFLWLDQSLGSGKISGGLGITKSGSETSSRNEHSTARKGRSVSSRKINERLEVTSENSKIKEVTDLLKNGEKNRSTLIFEHYYPSEDQSVFVFNLAAVPDAQISILRSKIKEIDTYRRGDDGELERWSEYLSDEFFINYLEKPIKISISHLNINDGIISRVQVVDPISERKTELPDLLEVSSGAVGQKRNWRFDNLLDF